MYRSIVALLEDKADHASLIRTATNLAQVGDGHISAVYVVPLTSTMFSMPDVVNVESFRNRANEVHEHFESALKAANVKGSWHYTEGGDVVAEVAQQSLYADIVLLRRNKHNHKVVDKVLLTAGCPALLLPPAELPSTSFDRILVAWKGTREAARALHDTLPLLHQANDIVIAALGELSDHEKQSLASYLAAHGIDAKIEQHTVEDPYTEPSLLRDIEKSIGRRLLALAKKENRDLIIMGAYGHSRFSEAILSGVTNLVSQMADIPVLMSH